MSDQDKGRIAIRLGAAASAYANATTTTPSSSSRRLASRPGAPSAPNAPSGLGKRPRPRVFGGGGGGDSEADSDTNPDSDDEARPGLRGRHDEAITAFGDHGAETAAGSKALPHEYVIRRLPNRDWRATARAALRSPATASLADGAQPRPWGGEDAEVRWGLTVRETSSTALAAESEEQDSREVPTARRIDEEALDALLGRRSSGAAKTIPRTPAAPLSEDAAYRRDAAAAGAVSTLEDYKAMPIDEFGAALLRGMGWDGRPRGHTKAAEVRRRPNRLGLGAKALTEAEDLGGWDQGGNKDRDRRRRPPRLDDFRRDERRQRESRQAHGESYKQERDRERERIGRHDHDDDGDRPRQRHRHSPSRRWCG